MKAVQLLLISSHSYYYAEQMKTILKQHQKSE